MAAQGGGWTPYIMVDALRDGGHIPAATDTEVDWDLFIGRLLSSSGDMFELDGGPSDGPDVRYRLTQAARSCLPKWEAVVDGVDDVTLKGHLCEVLADGGAWSGAILAVELQRRGWCPEDDGTAVLVIDRVLRRNEYLFRGVEKLGTRRYELIGSLPHALVYLGLREPAPTQWERLLEGSV